MGTTYNDWMKHYCTSFLCIETLVGTDTRLYYISFARAVGFYSALFLSRRPLLFRNWDCTPPKSYPNQIGGNFAVGLGVSYERCRTPINVPKIFKELTHIILARLKIDKKVIHSLASFVVLVVSYVYIMQAFSIFLNSFLPDSTILGFFFNTYPVSFKVLGSDSGCKATSTIIQNKVAFVGVGFY